ncbi:hypothetical protein FB45DRAFT_386084 [Roridomyces roridus]|uniref:Uncharacterized protein n=1 Tax=Roridomyces roridus TaxID=1738132 RepID=A0AAD7B2Y8_9AGAR|nr:hypothetical protein FB45DRAFT_386084 [Roridomyces roridus]
MSSPTFTIPISVTEHSQRTVQVVGFGFKAKLTTKVSGTLVIWKKVGPVDAAGIQLRPYKPTPEQPDAPALPPPLTLREMFGGRVRDPTPDRFGDPGDSRKIHGTLVAEGVKVRDFGYAVARVEHRNPHARALERDEEDEVPEPDNAPSFLLQELARLRGL